MTRTCTLCSTLLRRSDPGEHYAFCGVSGRMCRECAASLESTIGEWAHRRTELIAAKRVAEQAKLDLVQRELAEERLARASLEALPLSTRAAVKRRRAA